MKLKRILFGFASASALALALTACGEESTPNTDNENNNVNTGDNENKDNTENKDKTGTTVPTTLDATTLYCVGDSTVCSFNDSYYLPRYGYGTQLSNYLDEKVTVNNLALSGRSSKSFLSESNYTTLTSSIKSGDFLLIGFGHNDQKQEVERYTNPTLAYTDSTTTLCSGETSPVSFKYTLYNYYIKMAQDKGAYPILCTPIVRANANNDYTGSSGHKTSTGKAIDKSTSKYEAYGELEYVGGDYAKAIVDLGTELNVPVIDLTTITKDDYTALGYEKASDYHAFTGTKNGVRSGIDTTHTNMFGAKMNAYHIANALKSTSSNLKNYVKADITKPTYDADYTKAINTSYVEPTYESFTEAKASTIWTSIKSPWYGTVFGDVGGAAKVSADYFTINQTGEGASATYTITSKGSGKVASKQDSAAMIFQQIPSNKNFTFTATCTLTDFAAASQVGFGLVLRDDIFIDTYNSSINSNYICAGAYGTSAGMNACYARTEGTLSSKGTATFAKGDVLTLSINRVNQTYTTEIKKGDTVISSNTYTDYDLVAVDNNYMYVGMYAIRNITCTYSNVNLTITGDSVAA